MNLNLLFQRDAIKTDIAAIQKEIDDKWSEVWNVS